MKGLVGFVLFGGLGWARRGSSWRCGDMDAAWNEGKARRAGAGGAGFCKWLRRREIEFSVLWDRGGPTHDGGWRPPVLPRPTGSPPRRMWPGPPARPRTAGYRAARPILRPALDGAVLGAGGVSLMCFSDDPTETGAGSFQAQAAAAECRRPKRSPMLHSRQGSAKTARAFGSLES
jgi:hypothetical protein